ncbi:MULTISPECIES: Na/Pi cotransporter family protein [Terrabacteria group]|uniref:Na/Pi cotransporter family protein n=1 Tax=Bacillati TaxID=1783272 RepID=UPI001939EC98|nr:MULTISPECIES: Na/Pi cotransporter family protein [Terrabacteria group]MBW9212201.1 Na/Pi cotransporter family protein [Trueperella sp. zg.1013]QRG86254.1 Na/Pi cotransporter family protein [Bulleidia sp. zg-1006]
MNLSSLRWDVILGGFGLFLFGIGFMGDGLKAVAGDKLRDYINKYTTNPFSALIIGILITIIMQSSSASTAITIGLVRAGLMTLPQAAGIIMGANIGTTFTSLLISLNIDNYVLYFVFLGAMIVSFGKKAKVKSLGTIIMGFGLIFYGLNAMGSALSAIKDLPEFAQFAKDMATNPFLGLFAGTVMTGAVQASSATIGIVQKLYAAGALEFIAVLPFVFGANIGTTVTGILACIGGSTAAKRTAGIHILFNIIGTTVGMIFLRPYTNFIVWLSGIFGITGMAQIAVAHMVFNTTATIVFFPFMNQFCDLIRKILPGEEPKRIEINIDELDSNLAVNTIPSVAIDSAKTAIVKMASVVDQDNQDIKGYLNKPGNDEDYENLMTGEDTVNKLDKKITEFLIAISKNQQLTPSDQTELRRGLEITKNLERIGDLGINLVEFFNMVREDKTTFSPAAIVDMNTMFDELNEMMKLCIRVYEERDELVYHELMGKENEMDETEYAARQGHFTRMANGECTSSIASSVYVDILGTIERMGDHACNIARSAILDYIDQDEPDFEKH